MRPDLSVLADEARRLILALLYREGELCVCELTEALKDIQPKVSRQLAILKNAHWLISRREGTWVHYRLAKLPPWAGQLIASLVNGGVPVSLQKQAAARIKSFPNRPDRTEAS